MRLNSVKGCGGISRWRDNGDLQPAWLQRFSARRSAATASSCSRDSCKRSDATIWCASCSRSLGACSPASCARRLSPRTAESILQCSSTRLAHYVEKLPRQGAHSLVQRSRALLMRVMLLEGRMKLVRQSPKDWPTCLAANAVEQIRRLPVLLSEAGLRLCDRGRIGVLGLRHHEVGVGRIGEASSNRHLQSSPTSISSSR